MQVRVPVDQIRVASHLDQSWTDWFGGMAITNEDDGSATLSGLLPDQAALNGILVQIGNRPARCCTADMILFDGCQDTVTLRITRRRTVRSPNVQATSVPDLNTVT